MIKTAIFVEGQSELIFTRELLLKFFNYQNIWIECYNLFNDQDLNPTEYAFPNVDAEYYFQILNIGNDQKVLSSILKRERYLFSANQGFHKIIGLRDMYSKEYRQIVKKEKVDLTANEKFITNHLNTIKERSLNPEKIYFHFAIMELETWLLAIPKLFNKLHSCLNEHTIKQHLNVDLSSIDLESEVYHPADFLDKILKIAGSSYDKKKADVNKIMEKIDKVDVEMLVKSYRCESLNSFCDSLGIIPKGC